MPRGKKPYFTPEQDIEIARRYQAGEMLQQLADSYGVSTVPVVAALNRRGVDRRKTSDYTWQDTPESRAEIIDLWRQGTSVKNIAHQVHTRDANISMVLRASGLKARLGGKHRKFTDEQTDVLVLEFKSGVSLAELARRYDSNPITVRGTLRRAGVDTSSDRYKSGPDHPNWKGGFKTVEGYAMIMPTPEEAVLCPPGVNGYVLQHRLVMAQALGRLLTDTETVHHIDGDRKNNDISNLQLRNGHHGCGVVLACRSCGSHDVLAVPLAPEDLTEESVQGA